MKFEVKNFATPSELAVRVAESWLQIVSVAAHNNQRHLVALSGGRITNNFFNSVVEQVTARSIDLHHVHFFWADERCVPAEDAQSNFKAANDLLFRPLGIASGNVHRLKGELVPSAGAEDASAEILQFASRDAKGHPALDLIFLGMGEDGHVASLFPGAPESVANATEAYISIDNSPKPPPRRLTMTYTTITAAKEVWVLASGAGKEEALQESLKPGGKTPLARVLQQRSNTKVFTDIVL